MIAGDMNIIRIKIQVIIQEGRQLMGSLLRLTQVVVLKMLQLVKQHVNARYSDLIDGFRGLNYWKY